MKIKDLKNYGIPSYFINIWLKKPSPYLLPLQEDAVKNYGILDCEGSTGLPRRFAPRNDNLLIIAPTSSGKSFIGEMAAISRVIHHKKNYLSTPLKIPDRRKIPTLQKPLQQTWGRYSNLYP